MKNPNKFLRKAYIQALTNAGLVVYNKKIPPETVPIPPVYVLVTSQSKQPTERSKEDFEWNSRITLNIINVDERGYADTTAVDDAEEICITTIEAGVQVDNFYLKSIYLIHSQDLDMDDRTTSIQRRVLLYEHWLSEIGLGVIQPTNPGGGLTPDFTPILIPAGTPIPYFLAVSGYPGFGPSSEVITEVMWVDPDTDEDTGQLTRVYDIPVVRTDSNGDGTGNFTGWKIYGHEGNNTFQEDTYISLK